MKKIIFLSLIIALIIGSCTQNVKKSQDVPKIENTLKSVSFWSDSIGKDPHELFLSFDRVNKVIDSIGYPDAGYNLWLIQSDSIKDIRFLIEGYWPNQALYDTIHANELYKNAFEKEMKLLGGLKYISYNRFTLVK
jgi:hypothetical protein